MEYQDTSQQLLTWARSHFFGKYRGVVKDNQDSANVGRLKVTVPSVLGTLELWAMPCVPYAGDGVGFYSLPEAGTGVWIEFEAGDPSYPVWTGFFWGTGHLPDPGGAPVKIWKTQKITIRIDDDADEIVTSTSSDAKVALTDEAKTEAGGATHTVSSSGVASEKGSGKVEVTDSAVKINNGAFEVM
ncbi:MAG TPA: phage baseplate assembly protein V [Opitutaceae bacterium]|nr:phage baseplate assembly protein V [Opitutaceae bacterium]